MTNVDVQFRDNPACLPHKKPVFNAPKRKLGWHQYTHVELRTRGLKAPSFKTKGHVAAEHAGCGPELDLPKTEAHLAATIEHAAASAAAAGCNASWADERGSTWQRARRAQACPKRRAPRAAAAVGRAQIPACV